MYTVECLYNGKYRIEKAYSIDDFPFNELKADIKGKSKYISLPITFDIETSTVKDKVKSIKEDRDCYEGYAYHMQFCIEGKVLFCRRWDEVVDVFNRLINVYWLETNKCKLVCYIHNLSYEFQFMFRFFNVNNVFATDSHKVLKAILNDYIELRCSYFLSNQSLAKFIENTNSPHQKGTGDLDYSKIYTPISVLSEREKGYCYNDVKGLYEAILYELQFDTLDSIPLTNTGYIRRDTRNRMRKNKKNRDIFLKSALDYKLYDIMKKAFRGGNTASNRYLTNMILDNVDSYDMSSAYPYVMLSEKFPTGEFMKASIVDHEELKEYNNKYCTVAKYIFKNIKIKENIPIAYLPFSKCEKCLDCSNYNGRILNADYIEIYMTNIDFEIIDMQYEYDELYVDDFYFSRKEFLPKELKDEVYELFFNKSTLKGIEEKEYEYMKSKNKLNSTFGMCVTDILHDEFNFNDVSGEFEKVEHTEEDNYKRIEEYYASRNNFLSYQWGIFITAYCRRNLQLAIDKIGLDVVYCDTDSVKYVGNYDYVFNEINKNMLDHCRKYNIKNYVEYNDKTYYLGLYDKEKGYVKFKTLGAKKYAYIEKGSNKLGVTVAGLNKKQGSKELEEMGGIEAFEIGTTFYNSGRTTAYYNNDEIHYINIDGCEIKTASNIALVHATYSLGITDHMLSILNAICYN